MDIEPISKQQVILIALLVAIVTSIATAIATVSLTDGSDTSPQQTIYNVVERSIQKVADNPTVQSIVSPSKPVIIAPTELSPSDIAKASIDSIIRIYQKGQNGSADQFVAFGVATGKKNGVIASNLIVPHTDGVTYQAVTSDNQTIPVSFVKADVVGNFNFFVLNYPAGDTNLVVPIDLSDTSSLTLGSNVVALGGKESGNVVSTGIVTEFLPSLDSASSTASSTSSKEVVATDMALSSSFSGWLLFDTRGDLVALESGFDDDKTPLFVNADTVKKALTGLL